MSPNPCATAFDGTVIVGGKPGAVQSAQVAQSSPFDCFYVYPTVSTEPGGNADLRIEQAEVRAAERQASPFSQLCTVWAPVYRQVTLQAINAGTYFTQSYQDVAYQSLLDAWHDYLANYNNRRPIIFIGHSQGAMMLTRLLRDEVDANPTLRNRMVSAILLGGRVLVANRPDAEGSFHNIPPCRATTQTGCVIGYSTFDRPPAAGTSFSESGVSGTSVLCTNPADLANNAATPLDSYFSANPVNAPAAVKTPWVIYPALYTGSCVSAGYDTWFNVTRVGSPGGPPVVKPISPTWGLHLYDEALTFGNLLSDVKSEEGAFVK